MQALPASPDYEVQPLLPYEPSRQGPPIAVADVNGDGLDDVFIGGTANATGGQQGAQVENVANGSPAAGAGLQAGDVITAVDGTAVSSPADLARLVRSHQPGDQVTITYTRGGNSTDAPVQLGDRSAQNAPAS